MDDATTWRFRRFSPLAAAISALVHAVALAALLPESLPQLQRAHITDQVLELTFDPPALPTEAVAPDSPPQDEAEAGQPAPPPEAEASLEKALPPLAEPPAITGREFAKSPPAVQKPAPPPRQAIAQERPRRVPPQQTAEATERAARPMTEDGNRRAHQDYLWQIIRKLSQYRFHQVAREERMQGVVVTRLTVARDGRLLDVSLVSSSGAPNLDRGVIDTIRSASPFAPFPAEMTVDSHTFTVPIGYAREP
jgi:protein TonB